MLKKLLITLLVLIAIAGAGAGTWYFMNMKLVAKQEEVTFAQGETSAAKTQIASLETQLKTQADLQTAQAELLTRFQTLTMMSGSGRDINALEDYYDENVVVEGTLFGNSLRAYGLALQKYWKTTGSTGEVVGQPIQLVSGEWTAVVNLSEAKISAPLVLSQSGSVVRAPAVTQKELVLTLAKWKDGKIVEQYEFPYAGDDSKSNLLTYMTAVSGSGATQTETQTSDVIPASSKKMAAPTTPETASGTTDTGSGTQTPDEA